MNRSNSVWFSDLTPPEAPVVEDDDDTEPDSYARRMIAQLTDEHATVTNIDLLLMGWQSLTYDQLRTATGFYFTIKIKQLIGDSSKHFSKPCLLTSSALIFTKEEMASALENPYSIMRGVGRLIGHKVLKLKFDSVFFRLTANGTICANIIFHRPDLAKVHSGIANRIKGIDFKIMTNASPLDLRSVRLAPELLELDVMFSLADLSTVDVALSHSTVQLPTGAAEMNKVIQPSISPITPNLSARSTRGSSFGVLGDTLGSFRGSIYRKKVKE